MMSTKKKIKKKFTKYLTKQNKCRNFVKQFGETVGMSVKPWFPNLEKKVKIKFGSFKNYT